MHLIVGLGNPGTDYEYTRHNLGFLVARYLVKQHNLKWKNSSVCRGLVARGRISGVDLCILLPLTFMNNSGVAVRQILDSENISSDNMLVVCDDFNVDFGALRLRRQGSDGGHNGLGSIIYQLHSSKFARLRIGIEQVSINSDDIKTKINQDDIVDFVLSEFDKKEKKEIDLIIEKASECCLAWLIEDIDKVMSDFNRR